jgi:excisionase family DNA binding protein
MAQKMTEAEFAKVVGVSERTVRRKRHDREIQYHRVGWKIYYLQEDVDAWHETMKHEPIFQSKNLRRA